MAGAVVAAIVLTILLPETIRFFPQWLIPAVETALLIALIAGDPGKIDRRARHLRWLSISLVGVLVGGALVATGNLIDILIEGGEETDSASELLAAGSSVWAANIIAFALLYWELDAGGAAARAHRVHPYPGFAFPQQLNPDLAPPGWQPRFIDYLYLAFTNATALSPTDAMPMAPWAKVAMVVQALVSLAILALVVARAVNVFT
jgi:uncharacterized membrane protein